MDGWMDGFINGDDIEQMLDIFTFVICNGD